MLLKAIINNRIVPSVVQSLACLAYAPVVTSSVLRSLVSGDDGEKKNMHAYNVAHT